jgi:hypothetical protein
MKPIFGDYKNEQQAMEDGRWKMEDGLGLGEAAGST